MPPYPTLELAFRDQQTYHCRTLFVATFGAASLFAHSLVGSTPPSNRLNFSKQKQQSLADLYQVESSLFLIFNDHPDPMKELYIAKFLQQQITAESIIVLVAVSRTTLKEAISYNLAVNFPSCSISHRHLSHDRRVSLDLKKESAEWQRNCYNGGRSIADLFVVLWVFLESISWAHKLLRQHLESSGASWVWMEMLRLERRWGNTTWKNMLTKYIFDLSPFYIQVNVLLIFSKAYLIN